MNDSTISPEAHHDASFAPFAALIREAVERLTRDGWKRHITWLLSRLGARLDLAAAGLYRNYPDRRQCLTSVRLHSWQSPVEPPVGSDFPLRIASFEADPALSDLRARMEAREPHWLPGPSPAAVLIPVFADRTWWGFLWLSIRRSDDGSDRVSEEVGRLVATIIGNAVHDASIAQALRWSERLHRIQRDIALAAGRRGSAADSLSELLGLICEFGDFDAGAVDFYDDEKFIRIAAHGAPPGNSPHDWSVSSRLELLPLRGPPEAIYLGSDDRGLQDCATASGFHAVAFLPLVANGELVGAIELFSSVRGHVPTTVRRTLEGVAGEVSMLLLQLRAEETRRRIQAELEQTRRSAEELSRAKSDFMARMSHEFRTPLNAILGYAQMLRGEGTAGCRIDVADPSLDRIEQSARNLLSLVENILDQSHAENETLRIRPESIVLGEYLRSVEAVGALLAREKQLTFRLDVSGEIPARIAADGGRLRQVLYNLISNAVKFTEAGSIRLEVRRRPGRLRFAVTDSGEGIPPAERGRIFLPFRQKRDNPRSGSGLGLSISQQLVQLMGSRIWLASVEGVGSTFWFSLPLRCSALDDHPFEAEIRCELDDCITALAGGDAATLSDEALEHLIDLARIGDLAGIRAFVAPHLGADADADFYRELDRLADSFHLSAVRKFLEAVRESRLE